MTPDAVRPGRRAVPELGPLCADGDHDHCPHEYGSGGHVALRRRPVVQQHSVLCLCHCHHACPLFGRDEVNKDEWERRCACPAAATEMVLQRDRRAELEQRQEEARAETALVQAELRLGPGSSAESIRTDVLAALDKHGLTWHEQRIDQFVALRAAASSSGPKALVALRVTGVALRPYRELWRMLREHHESE